MNKNVKLLIFSLIAVIILSVAAPIQNVKFLNVDAVSAATNGGNASTQAQTPTNKPTTTTSATSKTFKGITRFLALHSYGEDVNLLQTLLNQHGYKLKVDGIFGPKTLAAVKDFQKKNGLKVDGIVGPKTLAKLNPAPTQTAASKPAEQPAVQSEKVAVKIGKVDYAAHGTKCFTVAIAAVAGDKIVAAYIDDYQFLPKNVATGVPNSDKEFGKNYPEGYVLGSKLTNAEYYSNNMKTKAGSTVPINQNFAAIVNYVKGKTISELESELAHKTKEEMVDAVTGATLQDTYGYITAIVEAAKVAKAANDNNAVQVDVKDLSNIKIGKVDYAAHGTKCFTIAAAAVAGDKIVAAYIDDYQFLSKDVAKGVPNSDQEFGKNYPQGLVLASKLTNAEYYSGLMKEKAGATVPIDKNFAAIVEYVKGKTISELEAILSQTPKDKMVDAVSGATLADTYGYVKAILEAAKAAK